MVNIAIVTPELYEKTISNAQEVKARKGVMVVIGQEGDNGACGTCRLLFWFRSNLGQIINDHSSNSVFMQLLSYHIAKFRRILINQEIWLNQ